MLRARPARERGTVLIVAMVVTLLLAGLCLALGHAARVDLLASSHRVERVQAQSIARGAAQQIIAVLAESTPGRLDTAVLRPQAEAVGDGVFWLIHPNYDDDRNSGYGVVREAAKLNINTATREMLLALPRMTDDIADAIIDWRDRDDEVTGAGAESAYYLVLDPPYRANNGPFETIYDLLLVRGVTEEIFLGEDANHNGILDPNEEDGIATDPRDNGDGRLDRGLVDLVTVYSNEPNTDASGAQRLNLNNTSPQQLRRAFAELIDEDRAEILAQRAASQRPYQNTIDFFVRAQVEEEEYAALYDRITTVNAQEQEGLIDVTTASREVLACLPGLDESDADAIIAARGGGDGAEITHPGFLVEAVGDEKAVAIGALVTTRSFQYTADILATTRRGAAFGRYQGVIDAARTQPQIVAWLDLSADGWPIEASIREALRGGEPVEDLPRRVGGAIR